MSKCTSVTLLERLNQTDDLMEVIIDDTVKSYMIGSYGDTLKFIGEDVIVTYRRDIYKGNIEQFIDTFTIPTRVNVLTRDDNIKLYVDQEDNFSNVCFIDVREGEVKMNAEVYCVSHDYESSPNATWAVLVIRDKLMRLAKLRLFDYEYNTHDFSGRYVRTDLRRTKYGFVTQVVTPLERSVTLNPEVTVAQSFITKAFNDDADMLNIISKYNMLERMKDYVDKEAGYVLVRIAIELSIADEMSNITNVVDTKVLKEAVLLSYFFTISTDSDYSDTFRNMALTSQELFPNKKIVMRILDGKDIPETALLKSIKSMVDTILFLKKGI